MEIVRKKALSAALRGLKAQQVHSTKFADESGEAKLSR